MLIVLTFGSAIVPHEEKKDAITTIALKASPERRQAEAEEEAKSPDVRPTERASPRATQEEAPAVQPPQRQEQPAPALIPISPKEMAFADIANLPRQPGPPATTGRPRMGPADTGGAAAYADTPRVGSAPNGEPLYAAAWYREPYDDELAGYLSTASGPGWGLIACRTAPDYRVEDCVAIDEHPSGSRIARAILAAAWQFQVRPPRIGGKPMIGEWVRIRIDYGMRPRPKYR